MIVGSDGLYFGEDGEVIVVGVGGMRWIVRRSVLPNPPSPHEVEGSVFTGVSVGVDDGVKTN